MHKWNSNDPQLESERVVSIDEQQSYAKQQFGVIEGETNMLGLLWNKREDFIAVAFPEDTTKRRIL